MCAGPLGNMENISHKFLINNENVPGKYVATKFKSITQIETVIHEAITAINEDHKAE